MAEAARRWDYGMTDEERTLAFAMASQQDGAIINVHNHADEARRVCARLAEAGYEIVKAKVEYSNA